MEEQKRPPGRPPVSEKVLAKIDKHLRAGKKPSWIASKVKGAKIGKVYELRRALQKAGEIA